jgi:hypothetical protein
MQVKISLNSSNASIVYTGCKYSVAHMLLEYSSGASKKRMQNRGKSIQIRDLEVLPVVV